MNPKTKKMMDNKIWEYLEILGCEAAGEGRAAERAYFKLQHISTVCNDIRLEVVK